MNRKQSSSRRQPFSHERVACARRCIRPRGKRQRSGRRLFILTSFITPYSPGLDARNRGSPSRRFHSVREDRGMPLLQSTGLVKKYGRRTVVDGVSTSESMRQGSSACWAPTGPARSQLPRMTTGQITPFAGRVYLQRRGRHRGSHVQAAGRLGMGYRPGDERLPQADLRRTSSPCLSSCRRRTATRANPHPPRAAGADR